MRRARALGVVAAALLLPLAACGGQDGAAGDCGAAAATPAASSTAHRVTGDPSAAASYWTNERMRDAEPAPMPTAEGAQDCR